MLLIVKRLIWAEEILMMDTKVQPVHDTLTKTLIMACAFHVQQIFLK